MPPLAPFFVCIEGVTELVTQAGVRSPGLEGPSSSLPPFSGPILKLCSNPESGHLTEKDICDSMLVKNTNRNVAVGITFWYHLCQLSIHMHLHSHTLNTFKKKAAKSVTIDVM